MSLRRIALALFCTALHMGAAHAASPSSADCLFNWAESSYPSVFAPAVATQSIATYSYRRYRDTYLAVANDSQRVVFVSPQTGGALQDIGPLSDWLTLAKCPASPTSVAQFNNFYYLQNLNGQPVATATIVDNGANVLGRLTFGPNASSAGFTPQANGNGYSWGGAGDSTISYGNGFGSNPTDVNLPAAAMICQRVPNDGGSRGKSTNVLVSKSAVPITSAAALAGLSFSTAVEDCEVQSGNSAKVDAAGNVTFTVTDNGVQKNISLTADQFSTALSGTPVSRTGSDGMVTFNAYSYVDSQSKQTRYALIEHGAAVATGLSRGYLGVWLINWN